MEIKNRSKWRKYKRSGETPTYWEEVKRIEAEKERLKPKSIDSLFQKLRRESKQLKYSNAILKDALRFYVFCGGDDSGEYGWRALEECREIECGTKPNKFANWTKKEI